MTELQIDYFVSMKTKSSKIPSCEQIDAIQTCGGLAPDEMKSRLQGTKEQHEGEGFILVLVFDIHNKPKLLSQNRKMATSYYGVLKSNHDSIYHRSYIKLSINYEYSKIGVLF